MVVLWGRGLFRLRGLCLRGDPLRFFDLPRVVLSLLRLGVRVLFRDLDFSSGFSGFGVCGAGMAVCGRLFRADLVRHLYESVLFVRLLTDWLREYLIRSYTKKMSGMLAQVDKITLLE